MCVYTAGNAFYTVALSYAPLSLCTSVFSVVLVWNGILGRLLLGERMTLPDVVGCTTIMVGIVITSVFMNESPTNYDASQLVQLAEKPLALAYACIVIFLLITFTLTLRSFEKQYPTFGKAVKSSAGHGHGVPGFRSGDAMDSRSLMREPRPVLNPGGSVDTARDAERCPSHAEATCAMLTYPTVCAMYESIVQVLLKAWSNMVYDTLKGNSQLGTNTFWAVTGLLFLTTLGVIYWLRRGYSRFEVVKLQPVQMGVLETSTIVAALMFYREYEQLSVDDMCFAGVGVFWILVGLALMTVSRVKKGKDSSPEAGLEHGHSDGSRLPTIDQRETPLLGQMP
jgi:hypothetical protein